MSAYKNNNRQNQSSSCICITDTDSETSFSNLANSFVSSESNISKLPYSRFDARVNFLQDVVKEAHNHLRCARVLVYSLNQDNFGHQCSKSRSWKPSEVELLAQLALQLGLALEQASLKEELLHQQKTQENEQNQESQKYPDFPKKISELQKISELLVENQTALQKLKTKISHQSANTNNSINQTQDINDKSITIHTNYPEDYLQLQEENDVEQHQNNQITEDNDLTLIKKPLSEARNTINTLNNPHHHI